MSHNHKIGLMSPSASVTIIPVLGNHSPYGKTASVSSILQPSLVTANNQNRKLSLSPLSTGTSVNLMQSKALLQRNPVLPDSTMSASNTLVTGLPKGSDPAMLSTGRNSKRASGTKSRGKNMTTSNPVSELDVMGCPTGRKGSRSGMGGHPPPASVARRNARERNRVKQVNNGFAALRQHIPLQVLLSMASESGTSSPTSHGGKKNKISKVDTLRCAVEYIRSLEQILTDTDPENMEPGNTSANLSPGIKSEWLSQCGSPNALNGGLLHASEGFNAQHLYHGESSAEELIDTSSEFNEDNFGGDDENISPRSLGRRIKVENNNDDPALYHHAFTFEDVNTDQPMHDSTTIEHQHPDYALHSPASHPLTPTERKPHGLNSSPPPQHLFAPAQTLPSLTRAFPGKALNFMLQPQQENSLLYHTKEKQNEDPNSSGELDPTGAGSYSSPDSGNLLLDSWWPIPSM